MPLSKARNRQRMRTFRLHALLDTQLIMRLRERNLKPVRVCEACGYWQTVDTHHEGELRIKHTLCPNCHGLITRRIKTLEQLLPSAESKPVQPKPLIDAVSPSIKRDGYGKASSVIYPQVDAEGQPIPEYI